MASVHNRLTKRCCKPSKMSWFILTLESLTSTPVIPHIFEPIYARDESSERVALWVDNVKKIPVQNERFKCLPFKISRKRRHVFVENGVDVG